MSNTQVQEQLEVRLVQLRATYGDLTRASEKIAAKLRELGTEIETVTGALQILKSVPTEAPQEQPAD